MFRFMVGKKLSVTLLLVIAVMLLSPISVSAILNPDAGSPQIRAVEAFHHLLEQNDCGFLVDYYCQYTAIPPEGINESFIVAVLNTAGTAQIRAVAPFLSTHLKGYWRGVAWVYFNAADAATLITWGGTHAIRFFGNPTIPSGWPGAPPSTDSGISVWSASTTIPMTQSEFTGRVLYYALELENAWGTPATWDMITDIAGGSALGPYGETYFSNVIPNLRTIAPLAFAGATTAPETVSKAYNQAYAKTLAGTVVGTPLNLTNLATAFGMSRMFMSTLLWLLGMGALLLGSIRYLGGPKVAIMLSIPMIIGGGLLGMIPLALTIGLGALATVMTAFVLFYRGSSA